MSEASTLLLNTLGTLRNRFEDGARAVRHLRCTLTWGPPKDDGDFGVVIAHSCRWEASETGEGRWSVAFWDERGYTRYIPAWQLPGGLACTPGIRLYRGGPRDEGGKRITKDPAREAQKACEKLFLPAARDAAHVVQGLVGFGPLDLMNGERINCDEQEGPWLNLLFRAAWEAFPGTTLRATKEPREGGGFESVLPTCVFSASATLCDLLADTTKTKNPPHADGPEEPCSFWYKNDLVELQPKQFKLLQYVWSRGAQGETSVAVSDVGGHIWNDRRMKYERMKSAVTGVNNALAMVNCRPLLSKPNRSDAIVLDFPS